MSEVKQPSDRKPKAAKFTFKGTDGKSHALPLAAAGAEKVPGRFTRDAIMSDDETVQMRLGFALLEACGASKVAQDALYDLPTPDMITTLSDWMKFGDGQGGTVPQS